MILTNDEIAMMAQGMMEEDAMRFRFEHSKTQEEIVETERNRAKFQNELKKQIEKETKE